MLSFLASSHSGATRAALVSEALATYQLALDQEGADASTVYLRYLVRMRLARSLSVFYHDLLGQRQEATNIADRAFDVAAAVDLEVTTTMVDTLKDLRANARRWEATEDESGNTHHYDAFRWVTVTQ